MNPDRDGNGRRGLASAKLAEARQIVRTRQEAGAPVVSRALAAKYGISHGVFDRAIAAELGRREGLAEAAIDPSRFSRTAREDVEACKRRLEKGFEERLFQGIQRHIQEVVLPAYNAELTEADRRLAMWKPPLEPDEYRTLLWALHEDQTNPERRAAAFSLIKAREVLLRGTDRSAPAAPGRRLPTTVAELLALREAARAERSARAKATVRKAKAHQ